MPDTPIVNRAIVTAPKDYEVPLAQEIILKAVTASIDGTGAASTFQPVLQLISDAGDVMWTALPGGQSIAAGGSADVSWFPLGSGGGAAISPGAMVSTYSGLATAADFTWTGPAGTDVSSGYPANPSWTKSFDETAILIIAEGDFTGPNTVPSYVTMGLWIDGNNEINVASHLSVSGGAFASVQLARIIGPNAQGTGAIAAGTHTLDMKVSEINGNTTTFRCHAATDLTILEYFPASVQ